jgi:hypothetical protein
MSQLAGMQIGTKARALVAALVLGGALFSLAPGQTAHAARAISTEAGDTDPGGARPSGPATRSTADTGVRCTITRPEGHVDFYVEGALVVRDGVIYVCGSDGMWHLWRSGASTGTTVTSGGVYAP